MGVISLGVHMARKPNHAYEKRQRELAKIAKQEAKRAKKHAAKIDEEAAPSNEASPDEIQSEDPSPS